MFWSRVAGLAVSRVVGRALEFDTYEFLMLSEGAMLKTKTGCVEKLEIDI